MCCCAYSKPRDTQHKTDVTTTRLWSNWRTRKFFIILTVQVSKYTAGSWENYQRNLDRIGSQMRKITIQRRYQFSFYKVKIINKPDFIILFLPIVLIQKSWLEMHTNKSVWTYRSLFISAAYTSKLWIPSFSETVKKFWQHQLSWFMTLARPCLKWLNDEGYAPNWSRSCVTPAAILSLKPWLVSSCIFGPKL